MSPLPADIYSVESVRRIDQRAINDAGIGGYTLMSRAGQAAFDIALAAYPACRRWQVVCGAGNNGGDGYVVARLAAENGIAVSVLALTPPAKLSGDAAKAHADFAAAGGEVAEFAGALDPDADLLIDGLLGSGLERTLEGRFARVVNAMNGHPAPLLALDMPSGLHGDSGAILGTAVRADHTVTFVGLKSGLFLGEGPALCGELHFAGLDIPPECVSAETPVLRRLDDTHVQRALPRRDRHAHKGDFGHVLIVGGGPGMPGAARLAGEAALRAGAGLVSIATHPSHSALIPIGRPELMCFGVSNAKELQPLLQRATCVAIGPGLGTGEWSQAMFDACMDGGHKLVIDADALTLLARAGLQQDDWILTPHPGEAARLLGSSSGEVQADRRAALAALQRQYAGTVVLKGAGSLVSGGDGVPWLCSAGNPGMASPGMGDALTGIVAALRSQGSSAEMAAAAGVLVHARAGDTAAAGGQRGMIASDLIAAIRPCVNP